MANVQERMEMIGSSILAQAQSESKELIAKAIYERDHELAIFEEQVIQEMFGKVQEKSADIRTATVRKVSVAQSEARQRLLKKRGELADKVFAKLRLRLEDYVKTPQYTVAILEELTSLKGEYNHASSTVYLREADMNLNGSISKVLEGVKLEADPTIRIGGWKLLNTDAGIVINETLDDRLEGQKAWFLANSGLSIA